MAFASKERMAEYGSAWYQENKERVREQQRWARVKRIYGVTREQYEQMLDAQGGRCAICGGTSTRRRSEFFHVDHCHDTGRVRGLLCHKCNTAIGMLGDDVHVTRRALEYLEREQ